MRPLHSELTTRKIRFNPSLVAFHTMSLHGMLSFGIVPTVSINWKYPNLTGGLANVKPPLEMSGFASVPSIQFKVSPLLVTLL